MATAPGRSPHWKRRDSSYKTSRIQINSHSNGKRAGVSVRQNDRQYVHRTPVQKRREQAGVPGRSPRTKRSDLLGVFLLFCRRIAFEIHFDRKLQVWKPSPSLCWRFHFVVALENNQTNRLCVRLLASNNPAKKKPLGKKGPWVNGRRV